MCNFASTVLNVYAHKCLQLLLFVNVNSICFNKNAITGYVKGVYNYNRHTIISQLVRNTTFTQYMEPKSHNRDSHFYN